MKILITGQSGQLGQELHALHEYYPDHQFTFTGRHQLDLSNPASIDAWFRQHHYDIIINAAAYTAVDKAEDEPELADQINHKAVKQLADIAASSGTRLLHVSTDYVFDGDHCRPWTETDNTRPLGVYGTTKCRGEEAVVAAHGNSAIVRTGWVYSRYGNNFVKTMLKLGASRPSLNVVNDQIGTPTHAAALAEAVIQLALSKEAGRYSGEIFHYSQEGVASWYDFACSIMELANLDCRIYPIPSKDYPTPAKRPAFSVLDKRKISEKLAIEIPHWRDELNKMLSIMNTRI